MSTNFIPANELEELLMAAAQDATARPRFCRTLLESELFVVVASGGDNQGARIQTWQRDNQTIVPVFSAPARLQEFMKETGIEEYEQTGVGGRELLTILQTAHVILNPVSDYGKEFYPEEIQGLLDGSELKRLKVIALDESQPVLLSQPEEFPHALISALKSEFAREEAVAAAYLAQAHQTPAHRYAQLVVGIEAASDYQPTAAIRIAQEILGEDEFISFLRLGPDSVSAYLRESTRPFYTRT
jgi:hypothetical protein